jgi:hypothetical protein
MRRMLLRSVITTLCVIAISNRASALKFTASMTPIRVEARPGQVINRGFRLTLDKDEKRTQFKVRAEDWWRSEDGKQSFYREAGTLSRSCGSWVKLNPRETAVPGGGTLDVQISIAVPSDVKPGGYWCALTVDETPDPLQVQPDTVGVRVLASLSVGIFVYVTPVERAAKILDLAVESGEVQLKIRNEGNCPLSVEGRCEFIPVGESKPKHTIPIARATILTEPANSMRLYAKLPTPGSLPTGRYLVRAILDIGISHYIGVQREMQITNEIAPSPPAPNRIP